ncbi:MAG: 4-(cytidine 5'-diphospho)-2-C-methyl-D-erythritol kinase [Candidatus Eremiobacteraeota bacterium]|nr:4-(cytidine 5'-diphospho)-2-C-methyl-D-erythritol kinase [Candidatus Eremiobacteraeota bacterium]MBV9264445.1 4-(cytidine 5'-diphospho)-2-C-methyl-D-erythritol kinase [Candidatus Eremiobacteraeota bacterium]
MPTLVLASPAKINLTLEVLARRADGYHGVRTLIAPLDLSDEIRIEPSPRFVFTCNVGDLQNSDNLVVAALRALGDLPPIALHLEKRIPVQAGLGGGSSNAATILRAAMEGAFGEPQQRDWLRVAHTLGSDVPFFLAGTAALVEGTGERVTPAGALPDWHALVIKPPVAVSTADAYRELDDAERPTRPRKGCVSIAALEALQRFDFERLAALLQNDFQEPIARRHPEIRIALDGLREAGAQNALLAGSGACVFSLAETRERLEILASRLQLPADYLRFSTRFAETPQWREPCSTP